MNSSVDDILSNDDIARYSRQLILPGFGVTAQKKLKSTSMVIVGVGGLGCPVAQYLLAAGCGHLGLVDYDEVERSNFHRQTLYKDSQIGSAKVDAAAKRLREINPECMITTYRILLTSKNAMNILRQYDIILDCTDNVATRYLLNDACVLLHKPLVSGSAIQFDGQLTIYNHGVDGPCYRCLYPIPPPPETVTNCGDGGVLGAVTGIIGSMQALEAIKLATNVGETLSGRLIIFDGLRNVFRNISLRPKRSDCAICSNQATITELVDYEQFCGMPASDKDHPGLSLLDTKQRIDVRTYHDMTNWPHLLIDVRQPLEFEICHLPGARNIPLKQILDNSYLEIVGSELENVVDDSDGKQLPVVVLCRRGNDSQIAVQHLLKTHPNSSIRDLVGGLHAWNEQIDNSFPKY